MTTLSALILSIATVNAPPQGVVLDFYSQNCPPCRQMDPVVSRLQRQGYAIRKVNVDEQPELANRFGIRTIPQFVLVVRGREVKRLTGLQSEAALRRLCMQIPTEPAADSEPRQNPSAQASSAVAQREPEKKSRFPLPFFNRGQENASETDRESDQEPVVRAKHDGVDLPDGLPADVSMASSARIRVKESGSINYGSGTIIDSRPGRTIVLTCGHVLRNLDRSARIEVDVFVGNRYETFLGKAVAADFQADVGLISIATEEALPASRVAGADYRLRRGESVFSIGCGGGEPPTRQQHQITVLNRYRGPDNIECTGVPVQGRSGGGLFNTKGQVVGVCMAADPRDKRGLYAGLAAVHDLLDEAQLSHVYAPQSPERTTQIEQPAIADASAFPEADFGAETIAFGEATEDPAEFDIDDEEFNPFAEDDALAERDARADESIDWNVEETIETPTDATDHSIAEIEEALAQAGEAEVVCIVRPLNNPRASSRVVIINRASPKFVAYLTGELEDQVRPTSARVTTDDVRSNSRSGQLGGHTVQAFHRRNPEQSPAVERKRPQRDLSDRERSRRQQFRFEPVVTPKTEETSDLPQPYRRSAR